MKREKKRVIYQGIRGLKRAIKEKCYDCVCGQKKTDCGIEDCSLYTLRPFKEKSK